MQPQNPFAGAELRNLLLALFAATAIMFTWQYFYERPRQIALQEARKVAAQESIKAKQEAEKAVVQKANDIAASVPRLRIESDSLHGTLPLVGNRIDDLTLARYRETQAADSPETKLLYPMPNPQGYVLEVGVLPGDGIRRVPTADTRWQANDSALRVGKPLTLTWNNGAGVTFQREITLDEHYMFTIKTTVRNQSGGAVSLYPYGLISRNFDDNLKHTYFMHEGPLGVMNDVLHDITYKTLREDGEQSFQQAQGWIGLTDKYWLTAVIPAAGETFDATYKHFKRGDRDAYQVDYRGKALEVASGESKEFTVRVFAGAKEVKRLEAYRAEYSVPLFDRAIDFGSLYFLTKPMFLVLNYFNGLVGNFGIAIVMLTLLIKLMMYPLANKSFTSMAQMKLLMPKMQELKERYKDDKMKMHQEVMQMYKREKVNPVSGCLPLLLQIPVFIALYRVLFVTIEMRHAPFYGWIHDLSAADPTSIFNLFGALPYEVPSFLHIGVLPIVMCITMVIQQKLNPKPTDEVQAMVITYMPYMFLVLFATFPAGLVLYWICNNVLSILQQLYIDRKLRRKGLK